MPHGNLDLRNEINKAFQVYCTTLKIKIMNCDLSLTSVNKKTYGSTYDYYLYGQPTDLWTDRQTFSTLHNPTILSITLTFAHCVEFFTGHNMSYIFVY